MGSGVSRHLLGCFRSSAGNLSSYPDLQPLDETLGHSFCYVRSGTLTGPAPDSTLPSPRSSSASASASDFSAAFKSISGASVSANSSAPLPIYDNATNAPFHPQPHFRSSSSFSAIPLQIASAAGATASGSLDRGLFLSGPIERGGGGVPLSGPLVKRNKRRDISGRYIKKKASLLQRSLSEKNRPWVVPLSRSFHAAKKCVENEENGEVEDVEWAHGKAGEDRVHVVVSESQRWLFVGIYDGFNGPEAPEFLVDNLYRAVFNELRGISWKEVEELEELEEVRIGRKLWEYLKEEEEGEGERLEFSGSGRFALSLGTKLRSGFGSWRKEEEKAKVVQEVVREKVKRRLKVVPVSDHAVVLRAMQRGLEVVESAYLEMTDRAMECNPELALMGSCLLVVLVRDEDVYVMNLGDSRAIVAQYRGKRKGENGGEVGEGEGEDGGNVDGAEIELPGWETKELVALQLSTDHSTSIEEEVFRIRQEHPDDDQCIVNGRVKGRLMVTRAFGAGYLKHPKWNDALLEIFRNEFIGTAPYVSSVPSLCHYKLGTNDQFLVLSSDGLYQYLNNEEVVSYVESFMERFPDGDPAQSLIEELLFRAAQKAGIGFTELLDIPQGDRRKYHDDVTVMVISLEGRIWKSSGKYM